MLATRINKKKREEFFFAFFLRAGLPGNSESQCSPIATFSLRAEGTRFLRAAAA